MAVISETDLCSPDLITELEVILLTWFEVEHVKLLLIVPTLFSNDRLISISSLIFTISSFSSVFTVRDTSWFESMGETNLLLDMSFSISELRNMRSEELTLLHLFLKTKSETAILWLCL
ncbi:hypothetical protein PanWU01x14_139610 [Parasponia andersonii]|uniref:Uncharacterized protein n=1 Tax=Parasponia andersonii TaxID=3476 RepID=A0A2P5CMJ7_PARAD|nr:hypothetical protein PanWU01x14_139610 [Parasponia andersonii]